MSTNGSMLNINMLYNVTGGFMGAELNCDVRHCGIRKSPFSRLFLGGLIFILAWSEGESSFDLSRSLDSFSKTESLPTLGVVISYPHTSFSSDHNNRNLYNIGISKIFLNLLECLGVCGV